ncbi:MAG TPA: DUF488 domain-containing protein [Firmicutes bacterium]|nr:DUF488 domain-containing protein [Candidatus Fermentithermobacillaceae bacterium]
MRLYTIGFTGKSAKRFFGLLEENKVSRVVDVRLRPSGQLAGFTKKEDLQYFLDRILKCRYIHVPVLSPTPEIMDLYRKDRDWDAYVKAFEALMDQRSVPKAVETDILVDGACLLCSEDKPERCHRSLIAERIRAQHPGVDVIHLV